ncbi:MAG: hypothetical protein PHT40_04260 [Patescibacteria group bacterium]|nr:hypothetical protein [Patescibacteria group bacterium]
MAGKILSPATQAGPTPERWEAKEGKTNEILRQVWLGLGDWKNRFRQEPAKVLKEMQTMIDFLSLGVFSQENLIVLDELKYTLALKQKMECILFTQLSLDQSITVDPLPPEFTRVNLERWAKINFRPVFLPKIKIDRNFQAKTGRYIRPENEFYARIEQGEVDKSALELPGCWCLADFSTGVDYTNGTQVFPNDPLAETIARLRQEKKIGEYSNTPPGSRFSITPRDEWEKVVCPAWREALGGIGANRICRPESCVEHNFIGNVFDSKNRGQFNVWQWFSDKYGKDGSARLFGGTRDVGGLAFVNYCVAGHRDDFAVARPIVIFN